MRVAVFFRGMGVSKNVTVPSLLEKGRVEAIKSKILEMPIPII
jgi:hypothetical protein